MIQRGRWGQVGGRVQERNWNILPPAARSGVAVMCVVPVSRCHRKLVLCVVPLSVSYIAQASTSTRRHSSSVCPGRLFWPFVYIGASRFDFCVACSWVFLGDCVSRAIPLNVCFSLFLSWGCTKGVKNVVEVGP